MKKIIATFEDVRRQLKGGQEEALLRKLWLAAGGEQGGEEGYAAILRGELTITLVDATVKLVDSTGRCIPLAALKGECVDAIRDFHLIQPVIDYTTILGRLKRFFAPETKFVSAEEFQCQSELLFQRIRGDKQVAHLLKGIYLPICLPQLIVADYGRTLEDIFLTAVERSYQAQFPSRMFDNHRKGELAGYVGVVEESRHQRLIEKMAEGSVVIIHFPNPIQGFSILADRKMIGALPEGFMLSGAFDTATSLVANPATLARGWNTPGLDCAANTWQSAKCSLSFRADDDNLVFGSGGFHARDNYSGGLSFVG